MSRNRMIGLGQSVSNVHSQYSSRIIPSADIPPMRVPPHMYCSLLRLIIEAPNRGLGVLPSLRTCSQPRDGLNRSQSDIIRPLLFFPPNTNTISLKPTAQ